MSASGIGICFPVKREVRTPFLDTGALGSGRINWPFTLLFSPEINHEA